MGAFGAPIEGSMPINHSKFKQAEYVRNVWAVTPEDGVTLDQVLEPSFWAHVAANLKPWDKIEVRAEDGTYYAELIVLQAARSWAKVRMIHQVELDEAPAENNDVPGYHVKFAGRAKWRVIRKVDNEVIHQGAACEQEAKDWLTEHLSATA